MKLRIFKHSPGFSLVELLISTMLGLMLIFSVLTLYASQKQTYQTTQALSRIRENAETAFNYLSNDIRMAGFVGCGRDSEIKFYNSFGNIQFSPETAIFGLHHGNSSANYNFTKINNILTKAKSNSDILIIQTTQPLFYLAHVSNNKIMVPQIADVKNSDLLLVSNCVQAELFHPNTTHSKTIVSQQTLQDGFHNVEVGRFSTYVYYIGNTQRKNQRGDAIYALCRQDLNASSHLQQELIDDVSDMQINYAGGGGHYFTADQVPDWKNISSVKIKLTLDSSAENEKLQREVEFSVGVRER